MRNLADRILAHALPALALVLCASGAWAQATGQLSGFVTNNEGDALPGVSVTVTNVATNQSRLAMTGQDGYFAAPLLPPGDYNVTAALEGFVQLSREGVRVTAAENARISMALSVGEFSETMTVTGETPLIEDLERHPGHRRRRGEDRPATAQRTELHSVGHPDPRRGRAARPPRRRERRRGRRDQRLRRRDHRIQRQRRAQPVEQLPARRRREQRHLQHRVRGAAAAGMRSKSSRF